MRKVRLGGTLMLALVCTLLPSGNPAEMPSPRVRTAGGTVGPRAVWVALEDAHEIAKVDIQRRRILARRSVPGAPHNLTISPDGRTIATALWSAASIVIRRDGRQRRVVLGGSPHDLKIDGGRIVVANQTEARLDIVTPRGRFVRSIGLKADPHDLALRWNGHQAWVTLEGSDDLAVVRISSGRVRYISTGKSPHDLLFAPDGKLWVSDWHGAVHVFSERGHRLKTITIGDEAHHLDFTPDGRHVWITDHGAHRIFVIRTRNYTVRKRFRTTGSPHHIAITADGDRAVVADHDRDVVVVYNVNKMYRAYSIPVGAGPHGIWAMP